MTKIIFFLLSIISATAFCLPKAVILIRHAEEPEADVNYLSEKGFLRAKQLPRLFTENLTLKSLGQPTYLFAAGVKSEKNSIRSIQTLKDLALKIKIPVNKNFIRDDYISLVHEILDQPKYDNQIIMICWQHKILSDILSKLGGPKVKYPSGQYDRLWLLTYDKNKKAVFHDLPQKLLPGDDLN